jgi:hypothetical protein
MISCYDNLINFFLKNRLPPNLLFFWSIFIELLTKKYLVFSQKKSNIFKLKQLKSLT